MPVWKTGGRVKFSFSLPSFEPLEKRQLAFSLSLRGLFCTPLYFQPGRHIRAKIAFAGLPSKQSTGVVGGVLLPMKACGSSSCFFFL